VNDEYYLYVTIDATLTTPWTETGSDDKWKACPMGAANRSRRVRCSLSGTPSGPPRTRGRISPSWYLRLTSGTPLQREEFHIGAAPIGPKELGRNSRYVFALPARYNFSFPTGFEEVEKILEGSPLQVNETFSE
jgi:hypothetical protein